METSYFDASWNDIRNSPAWFPKVLLLGLISMIPIFGSIVVNGYAWGWARDIAWDVHRPLPKAIFGNEDGKLYSRGFFALLLAFIIAAVTQILLTLCDSWPGCDFLIMLLEIAATMLSFVAIMRESIYARYSAGFQFAKIWAMAKHDYKGLLRILGMRLLVQFISVFAIAIVCTVVVIALLIIGAGVGVAADIDWNALSATVSQGSNYASSVAIEQLVTALLPVLGFAVLLLAVFIYAVQCINAWFILLQTRAMGYWTRQFQVAQWLGQEDPMPFEIAGESKA